MESPFCGAVPDGTRLIETFGWSPTGGFARLDAHLARMARSATILRFDFDQTAAKSALVVSGVAPLRCRLTLGRDGFEFTTALMTPVTNPWRLTIASDRLSSNDPWLSHKTTQRALYDTTRANLSNTADEALFLNERQEACEGTITNLFVTVKTGEMLTPPLSSGLLPGILRQALLANGTAREAVVDLDMLRTASSIKMGNSLRGLIPAKLIDT